MELNTKHQICSDVKFSFLRNDEYLMSKLSGTWLDILRLSQKTWILSRKQSDNECRWVGKKKIYDRQSYYFLFLIKTLVFCFTNYSYYFFTVEAMKTVEAIKLKRQAHHIHERQHKGRAIERMKDVKEVQRDLALIKSPAAGMKRWEIQLNQVWSISIQFGPKKSYRSSSWYCSNHHTRGLITRSWL